MNAEQELIKGIAKEASSDTESDIKEILEDSNFDWDLCKQLLLDHQLIPLAYLRLNNFIDLLPEELAKLIKTISYSTLQRAHRFWREFLRIAEVFRQSSITLVPIKGVAFLADIYQDNFLRPMVDIDLLVKEEDLTNSESIILGLGYKKDLRGLREEYWLEKQYHIPFQKNDSNFTLHAELHWALDYKRKNRHLLPEMWDRLRDIQLNGRKIKLLSLEDTLFSLALHSRRLGDNLCLKNVYDAVILMREYEADFDWDYCLAMAEKYDMRVTLFFLLEQMQFLSGYTAPEQVYGRLNISALRKRIIRMFIARNTFSVKKPQQHKKIYAQLHFLLYDTLLEPLAYAINIPREQFAKYFGLKPYSKEAEFFYQWRFAYVLKKLFIR